jgi:hypothetical protein
VTPTPRRTPPWSRKTEELVQLVAARCPPALQAELARWIEANPRFATFVTSYQEKVRKKLSNAEDAEARLDVRAELLVAYAVLADRRFEVAFEAYGSHQRGPDLSLAYRVNQRLNLEVTRLRSTPDPPELMKLASVVAAKVRQLGSDASNAVVLVGHHLGLTTDDLQEVLRLLKSRAESKDDAFFASRGWRDAHAFHSASLQLSGLIVLDAAADSAQEGRVVCGPNSEARRPISDEARARLMSALAAIPAGR